MADGWPLVGRDDELEYVLRSLEERDGVLLAGEAGVGKSRLASEVLAAAAALGWSTVALGVGAESAAVPFAPFAPLLGEDAAGDGVDRFMRATRALEARGERVLLHIDDAHLLDEVSTAFVRHLLAAATARLLLTARSGAPMPSALATAWQSGLVLRVELQPLARGEVESLLERGLGAPVDLATTRWVWRTSGGNPLFVRELVLDALESGGIEQRQGRWTLTTPTTSPGPRLLEVVAARLGTITDDEREAVELLAVGEPLGLALFEHLVGPERVQSLERQGLVATREDRLRVQVTLAHPLHGEVIREGLGASTARARRRRLIEALSATGAKRPGDALRIAMWRCDVGDTGDWQPILEAAKDLSKAFDRPVAGFWRGDKEVEDIVPLGRSHLEVALRLARSAHLQAASIDSAFVVFGLLMRLGRFEEAEEIDSGVDDLVRSPEDMLAAARMRASAAFFYGADIDRALTELRAAEAALDDPALVAAARTTTAQLHVFGRRHLPEAIEIGLAVGEMEGAARLDRLAGPTVAAAAMAELGQTSRAVDVIDRLIGEMRVDDDATVLGLIMSGRVVVLALAGRYAEAEQLATIGLQVSHASGSDEGAGVSSAMLASIELALGKVASSARSAREAVERLADVDILGARRSALVTGTTALALAGDLPAATRGVAALDDLPRPQGWHDDEEVLARAWVDVLAGRASAAVARLEAAAERARYDGRSVRELTLLHAIARLGNAAAVAARVEELAPSVDTTVAPGIADFVAGVAGRDAVRLAAAAECFAGAGARLLEAESWAQAAVVLDGEGRRSSAAAAATRSRVALEACEGASTPALDVAGPKHLLTKRESEIAELAARGLTDREIADTLVVSPRTVQTHLYNAYAKLGVDGRAGLADVLGTS